MGGTLIIECNDGEPLKKVIKIPVNGRLNVINRCRYGKFILDGKLADKDIFNGESINSMLFNDGAFFLPCGFR